MAQKAWYLKRLIAVTGRSSLQVRKQRQNRKWGHIINLKVPYLVTHFLHEAPLPNGSTTSRTFPRSWGAGVQTHELRERFTVRAQTVGS